MRPCERCGDKKVCKDGKRKKAKYLDGTADEDLTPTQEKEADAAAAARAAMSLNRHHQFPFGFPSARPSAAFPSQQGPPSAFPLYAPGGGPGQVTSQPYGHQVLPLSHQYLHMPQQQSSSLPMYGPSPHPSASISSDPMQQHSLANELFPDLNLDDNPFDNNYGFGEYSVLGHMSSGMVDTPPNESVGSFDAGDGKYGQGMISTSYSPSSSTAQQYRYPQPDSRRGAIAYNLGGQGDAYEEFVKQEERTGFPGAANGYPTPMSGPSPQGMMAGFEGNLATKEMNTNVSSSHQAPGLPLSEAQSHLPSQQASVTSTSSASTLPSISGTLTTNTQSMPSRRSRNPSQVYSMVTEPYSYTKAFHDLMALIRKRFSQKRIVYIAKALASIRPSFISSLTKLDDDDRIFMEKCLQRTLLEYEDNLSLTGTPTIICRRTGEIVAVGEGFTILTGWRKSVLLGKEPNLNVNTGGAPSGAPDTGTSTSRGTNTPRTLDAAADPNAFQQRPRPVSIVDLLDDESVCDFFDDYAHLAFGDSRGSITTPCKLLKYRTAKNVSALDTEVESRLERHQNWSKAGGKGNIAGEDNEKMECMLCWLVKRDVFDIPMLIVMSFLPCI